MDAPVPPVLHDAQRQRFHLTVDGLGCECDYRLDTGRQPPVMTLTHTGVPPALEGRGLAARLVAAALAHARDAGWRVVPQCSYVAVYMRRHPETADLLAR